MFENVYKVRELLVFGPFRPLRPFVDREPHERMANKGRSYGIFNIVNTAVQQ